jgi:hypothetical protein
VTRNKEGVQSGLLMSAPSTEPPPAAWDFKRKGSRNTPLFNP